MNIININHDKHKWLWSVRGHSQIENSTLNVNQTSRSWPPTPNQDVDAYFWRKQRSTFSQMSIAIVNSHQSSILYIGRTSWNCNITRLFHIACTFVATDCWKPKHENFLLSAAFLFNGDSGSIENTCNLTRLGKSWNQLNFFSSSQDWSLKQHEGCNSSNRLGNFSKRAWRD